MLASGWLLSILLNLHAGALQVDRSTADVQAHPREGGPFANVLLIIHCRHDLHICRKREPLHDGYKAHFGAVRHMDERTCGEHKRVGDPSLCIGRFMEGEGAAFDGVFYMHFDAVLSPCSLGRRFDEMSLGWFTQPGENRIGAEGRLVERITHDDTLEPDDTMLKWGMWSAQLAADFNSTLAALAAREVSELRSIRRWRVFTSEDDLFYVPKAAYKSYMLLAKEFADHNVGHEVAGPTMRKILEEDFGTPAVDFGCRGGCCQNLRREEILAPDFRCGCAARSFPSGHRLDLSRVDVSMAYKKAVAARC